MSLPADGIDLGEKQDINAALLRSGANIREINCVRRHLSAVKGGRLAAACYRAELTTLIISDVPGDRLVDIASGPTVGDPTTCVDALEILDRYNVPISMRTRHRLETGELETIKPGSSRLSTTRNRLIATPQQALVAAAEVATHHGITPVVLGDRLEGEARDVGKALAGIAMSVADGHSSIRPPCVLLSGGETTVTVRGAGEGGRNVEFLLSLGLALEGRSGIYALAADTDGIDGVKPVAGGIVRPNTIERANAAGIDPQVCLDQNDCHRIFEVTVAQVVTGPTLTNVNDFRAILVN